MYEIRKVNENVFYADCPSRVGIVRLYDNKVFLVDTSSSKDAIKKIKKNLDELGFSIEYVVNTHSHADHIGGNKYLQDNFNVLVYGYGLDKEFINNPILESIMLYGANPYKELKNKFLCSSVSVCNTIPDNLKDFSYLELAGHSFSDIVIKSDDNIWFIGDTVFSKEAVDKYHVPFIFDVNLYLQSLSKLEKLDGKLFIPSHGPIITNIKEIVSFNIEVIRSICNLILDFCGCKRMFSDIFKYVFDFYHLNLDYNQSVLIGSTIRSFITYLIDDNKLKVLFLDNNVWYVKI